MNQSLGTGTPGSALPTFALTAPTAQQTLDLFRGRWASRLPEALAGCEAGAAPLFQDPRIDWAVEKLGTLGVDVRRCSVLELGPLEGGHTYQLSRAGARSVTAVEANPEAYLKCLVVKELLGMERVNFLFGDGVRFLQNIGHSYDLTVASGFLYHLVNPVECLELICKRSRSLFLWTVFWDGEFQKNQPEKMAGSGPAHQCVHAGFQHTLHRHDYGNRHGQFWGGTAAHSHWMELDDILGALRHFGFGRQAYEVEPNPNGTALRLVAVADA